MKRTILVAVCFGISAFIQAWGTGNQTGYVKSLNAHWPGPGSDGKFDVVLDSAMGGQQPVDCNQGEWSGYLNNAAGRAQYAALLAALTSKQKVNIVGNNYCESTREVIRNVYVLAE